MPRSSPYNEHNEPPTLKYSLKKKEFHERREQGWNQDVFVQRSAPGGNGDDASWEELPFVNVSAESSQGDRFTRSLPRQKAATNNQLHENVQYQKEFRPLSQSMPSGGDRSLVPLLKQMKREGLIKQKLDTVMSHNENLQKHAQDQVSDDKQRDDPLKDPSLVRYRTNIQKNSIQREYRDLWDNLQHRSELINERRRRRVLEAAESRQSPLRSFHLDGNFPHPGKNHDNNRPHTRGTTRSVNRSAPSSQQRPRTRSSERASRSRGEGAQGGRPKSRGNNLSASASSDYTDRPRTSHSSSSGAGVRRGYQRNQVYNIPQHSDDANQQKYQSDVRRGVGGTLSMHHHLAQRNRRPHTSQSTSSLQGLRRPNSRSSSSRPGTRKGIGSRGGLRQSTSGSHLPFTQSPQEEHDRLYNYLRHEDEWFQRLTNDEKKEIKMRIARQEHQQQQRKESSQSIWNNTPAPLSSVIHDKEIISDRKSGSDPGYPKETAAQRLMREYNEFNEEKRKWRQEKLQKQREERQKQAQVLVRRRKRLVMHMKRQVVLPFVQRLTRGLLGVLARDNELGRTGANAGPRNFWLISQQQAKQEAQDKKNKDKTKVSENELKTTVLHQRKVAREMKGLDGRCPFRGSLSPATVMTMPLETVWQVRQTLVQPLVTKLLNRAFDLMEVQLWLDQRYERVQCSIVDSSANWTTSTIPNIEYRELSDVRAAFQAKNGYSIDEQQDKFGAIDEFEFEDNHGFDERDNVNLTGHTLDKKAVVEAEIAAEAAVKQTGASDVILSEAMDQLAKSDQDADKKKIESSSDVGGQISVTLVDCKRKVKENVYIDPLMDMADLQDIIRAHFAKMPDYVIIKGEDVPLDPKHILKALDGANGGSYRLGFSDEDEASITKIQAAWRGTQGRKRAELRRQLIEQEKELASEQEKIVRIQSQFRGMQARRWAKQERKRRLEELEAAAKIKSMKIVLFDAKRDVKEDIVVRRKHSAGQFQESLRGVFHQIPDYIIIGGDKFAVDPAALMPYINKGEEYLVGFLDDDLVAAEARELEGLICVILVDRKRNIKQEVLLDRATSAEEFASDLEGVFHRIPDYVVSHTGEHFDLDPCTLLDMVEPGDEYPVHFLGEEVDVLPETEQDKVDHDFLFSAEEKAKIVKIQSVYRGHRGRRSVAIMKQQHEDEKSIQKIQSLYRGNQARKKVAALKLEKEMKMKEKQRKEEEQIIKIQSLYRGRKSRKRVQNLRARRKKEIDQTRAARAQLEEAKRLREQREKEAAVAKLAEEKRKQEELERQIEEALQNPQATMIGGASRIHQGTKHIPAGMSHAQQDAEREADRIEQEESFVEVGKQAEQGDVDALYHLACAYENGEGTAKDTSKAVDCYRKAANAGQVSAMYNLGVCYKNGQGVKQDIKKAIELYTKAAELGDEDAQFNLAVCYQTGDGVPLNLQRAIELYTMASDQGDPDAQFALGVCYESGEGVAQDYKKAAELYTLAAEQGSQAAQFNLAVFYRTGQGVEQDNVRAAELFVTLAEQGDPEALFALAICHVSGEGVEKDDGRALYYFQAAAERGHEGAIHTLELVAQQQ